ncbi:MAG: extracellular solute-binding protein [Chloroflexi bacterium]|nr:extracellular solute-binding protein [Chloroflexota bacterium]
MTLIDSKSTEEIHHRPMRRISRRSLLTAAMLTLTGCASSGAGERNEVVLWYEDGLAIAPVLPDLVKRYNATRPKRIVVAQPQPQLSFKLLVVIGAHDAPNIVLYPQGRAAPLAIRGAMLGLEGFARRDNVGEHLFPSNLWQGGIAHNSLWGLPVATDAHVLICNQHLFSAAKVQPQPFWSSTLFDEACTKLVQKDSQGYLTQTGAILQGVPFEIWLWQLGTDILTSNGKGIGFSGPASQAALSWLMHNEQMNGGAQEIGRLVSKTTLTEGINGVFTHGKLGMLPGTFSDYYRMRNLPSGAAVPLSLAALPVLSGGKPSTLLESIYAFIPQASAHPYPEDSWQFIKWLATDSRAQTTIASAGAIPALTAAQQQPPLASDPAAQLMLKVIASGRYLQEYSAAMEIAGGLNNDVDQALAGAISPQRALANAISQGQQVLRQNARLSASSHG